MNLGQYEGKKVRLISKSGKTYIGIVGDYIDPEDNEPEGIASVVLDIPGAKHPVEFPEHDIVSIEAIS